MARLPQPLPPALARRAFARAEALEAGVSVDRLRRTDLARPFRSVRVPTAAPTDDVDLLRALHRTLPPGAQFSHLTALRLLGVDIPRELQDDRVHLRVRIDGGRARREGLRSHAVRHVGPSATIGGLPVSPPARAWLDCAALRAATTDSLVLLGDALLRRRTAVARLSDLVTIVADAPPGSRGLARARAALSDVRERTDSVQESRARLLLVRAGLPCPEVNAPVLTASGHFLALPDMLYREERVIVEYDGDVHRVDRNTWVKDIHRRERLHAEGWTIVTITAEDLRRDPTGVVARVRTALNHRSSGRPGAEWASI